MAFLGLDYIYPSAPPVLEDRTLRTESLAFNTNIVRRPGYRWRVAVNLRPAIAHSTEARAVVAHMTRHGYHTPFMAMFPQLTAITGADDRRLMAPVADATAVMVTAGIPTGRYVGILGRVYMVTTGRASAGEVSIYPPLGAGARTGTRVYASPLISVYYDDEFPLSPPPTEQGTVRFVLRLKENVSA